MGNTSSNKPILAPLGIFAISSLIQATWLISWEVKKHSTARKFEIKASPQELSMVLSFK